MGKGLEYCGGQWQSTFCITKLLQALFSSVLMIIIIMQIALSIKLRGNIQLGFTQSIQILMILTLTCNLAFCINHQLGWFYYSQSFCYDWYFCTLVFYLTYRIVQKSQPINYYLMNAVKAIYVFIIALFFAIFIYSGIIKILQCKEIWFLGIDLFGLVICLAMIYIGARHHRRQTEKMSDFKNLNQINNPLSKIWTLILINLFCQIVQLTETLIFLLQGQSLRCKFTQKQDVDIIIKFIFSIFSLHLSFTCTIVVFYYRRKSQQQSVEIKNKVLKLQGENNLFQMFQITQNRTESIPNSI